MNTTKLFSFLALFIASVMFVIPVGAITYEGFVSDPTGIGFYDAQNIIISEGTSPSEIYTFNPDGAGSGASGIVWNASDYIEDWAMGKDGYAYFVLTTGEVYQYTYSAVAQDFHSMDKLLLSDMDASSTTRSIVVDTNGNVYSTSGFDVVQYTYPSFTEGVYDTFVVKPYKLGLHEDGLLVMGKYNWFDSPQYRNKFGVYISDGTTITTLFEYISNDSADQGTFKNGGVFSTQNGDVYAAYYVDQGSFGTVQGLKRYNYSNSYAETNIATFASSDTVPEDIFITSDGIIYAVESHEDVIKTYSTDGLSGGYFYAYTPGSTGEIQLEYDVSTLNSVYIAYNNDSVVELVYNIDIDLVIGITSQDFYGDDDNPDFYYVVDVLDEDGIRQKTSIISTFEKDYNIVSGWHILYVGILQYSANPWEAGNWTAVLYEYDINTGLRAALDNCEFEIYNQVSDTTVIDETPGIDPTLDPISRIDALLKSNAFIGLLIILACIGAFGKVGGFVGVILGTVAGVSLATLLGYIPGWFMFVMIMTLCIIFASKIVGQIGGGNE